MTKQTKQLICIGVVLLFGSVSLWQFLLVRNLDGQSSQQILPIDYLQLERVVKLWEQKKQFTFKGISRPSPSQDERSENENETVDTVTVTVRNGSGQPGAASSISNNVEEIDGVTVLSVGNAKETTVTSVSYKELVSAQTRAMIVSIVEKEYGSVSESVLSDKAEFDVIITLGGSTP